MRVVQVTKPFELSFREERDVEVPEGFCKIKMQKLGLFEHDLDIYTGRTLCIYPAVLGRAGVGIVSEVGENRYGLSRGVRVVVDPKLASGGTMGYNERGLLADFAVVPCKNALPVPAHVCDTDLLFTEAAAIAIRTINELQLKKGSHILIVGANVFGIIAAKLVLHSQAIPIIIDSDNARLKVAAQAGIYYALNPAETVLNDKLNAITGGTPCDCAIFCSEKTAFTPATDYLSMGARIALAAWNLTDLDLQTDLSLLVKREFKIMGISNGSSHMANAVNHFANRIIAPSELFPDCIRFEEIPEFFAGVKARQEFSFLSVDV